VGAIGPPYFGRSLTKKVPKVKKIQKKLFHRKYISQF
jgi:hypothetical protein